MALSRERTVQLLTLVAEGLSNEEIVRRINVNADLKRPGWESWTTVTRGSVQNLLGQIFGQLGAVNRTQAVHLAHQKGYLGQVIGFKADILFEDGTHVYHSTHCRHGNHEACKATKLAPGVPRRPAQCKTCGAPCVCPDCDHGGASA